MAAKRQLSSSRLPDGTDADEKGDLFSDTEDDADSADYNSTLRQEPERACVSPIHAIFMAAFYGGFGLLGVFEQTWIMCWFMNLVTDPLGLERVEVILERRSAQHMMRLVGLTFVGLSVYYMRQRDDAAFLRNTVYGRLVAGGIGVSSAIILRVLPSACWLIWCADVFPALILLWALGDKGKEIPTGAIHPIHGLWGALSYFSVGILGATRQLHYLVDIAALFEAPGQTTKLEDLILPGGAQDVMRLSGLPLAALGFYYFRHRGDRDFMLSSVHARLIIGGLGLLSEVVLCGTLPAASLIICVVEVVPALLCLRALRNAGQCGCFTNQSSPMNDTDSELSAEV